MPCLRILRAARIRVLLLVISLCFWSTRRRGEAAVAQGEVSRQCVEERARRLRCWCRSGMLRYVKIREVPRAKDLSTPLAVHPFSLAPGLRRSVAAAELREGAALELVSAAERRLIVLAPLRTTQERERTRCAGCDFAVHPARGLWRAASRGTWHVSGCSTEGSATLIGSCMQDPAFGGYCCKQCHHCAVKGGVAAVSQRASTGKHRVAQVLGRRAARRGTVPGVPGRMRLASPGRAAAAWQQQIARRVDAGVQGAAGAA